MKDYDKNEESLYLKYWDANNLYGWAMSPKLPVNSFERTEDTSQSNEDFIKTIMKKVMKDIFLKSVFSRVPWCTMGHRVKMGHFWIIVTFSKLDRCHTLKAARMYYIIHGLLNTRPYMAHLRTKN